MGTPRVFTIPASAPFVPTLVRALIAGRLVPGFPGGDDPLARARATLYLPTRRACRLARDLFLDAAATDAAILPRIVALGDIDEDEIAFAQEATGPLAAAALALPPMLGAMERRLLLTRLVMRWAAAPALHAAGGAPLVAGSPAAALALADDLARLIDDMTTRQVPWQKLDTLVPSDFDDYWQLTLRFLAIVREEWPKLLAERGAIEPAARRDALIEAEAARLAAHVDDPVIAAGSTGSMPATAKLIATIAALPHGAVVLPGLDHSLDAESWRLIDGGDTPAAPGHPQFAMQALLRRIGIEREQVATLGAPATHGRERLASEALRPALATDRWQRLTGTGLAGEVAGALATMAAMEAANAGEEALAIAVALREALETPGKTAALVTPDRALARRVLAALARWSVPVEDSGGDALPDTPAGTFARLAIETALGGAPPVKLLALLKHPLARLGTVEGGRAGSVAALEKAVLRGPRPRPGSAGLKAALAILREEIGKLRGGQPGDVHGSDPRAALRSADLDAAELLAARLADAFAPLEPPRIMPFADLAALHRDLVAALSEDDTGVPAAFAAPDGEALATTFAELARLREDAGFAVRPEDYPELFHALIAPTVVRRQGQPGLRVRIFGLLEARLQQVDCVVLGGLVEGVWPPEARSDPWLSRPMRQALGLDLPERRISLSAHDFAQALGAGEVILAWPAKLAGAPTVTSRFVQRLAAVAGADAWEAARRRGERYLALARALDRPAEVKRAQRPRPRPPRVARPVALSVTEIEAWLRDPYTIYAKHILRLRELDPVDLPPGAADRGIMIHRALSEFTRTFAQALPADPVAALIEIGARHFAPLEGFAEARAFWWPRFERIARWFAAWEVERRRRIAELTAETSGRIEIPLDERTFTLRGRADRIERLVDGGYAVLDYKTGQVPTEPQVRIGIAPQLTLEAAMLRRGGFAGLPVATAVTELVYVSLKGGVPPGEECRIDFKEGDPDQHAERAYTKLREVAERFEDPAQPYLPLMLTMWKNRYGTYDHLARVKEWATGGPDEAEGGE